MYYNDNDAFCGSWLNLLIHEGHLPPGLVDVRSILEVKPEDCARTSHFFAGIGGWPLALKMAGWPKDQPVWTGSCPCQPFSAAGKRKGEEDERHLWPAFRELISKRRPPVVFGEQVASNLGRDWLRGVRADLEALGYRVGAADLCAAGVGAPHIRQRLYWVADTNPIGGRLQGVWSPQEKPWSREQYEGLLSAEARMAVPAGKDRALSDGLPNRMGRLRAYGNAIVPQVAAAFIRAYLDTRPDLR